MTVLCSDFFGARRLACYIAHMLSHYASVRPSVRHTVGPVKSGARYDSDHKIFTAGCHEDSGFFLTKFRAAGWGDFSRTRASKRGTSRKGRCFVAIGSSSKQTVTDRQRHAPYNKHDKLTSFHECQH